MVPGAAAEVAHHPLADLVIRRPWVLGEEVYARLVSAHTRPGEDAAALRSKKGFSLLEHIGFAKKDIAEAEATIIGRMTIEGRAWRRMSQSLSTG